VFWKVSVTDSMSADFPTRVIENINWLKQYLINTYPLLVNEDRGSNIEGSIGGI